MIGIVCTVYMYIFFFIHEFGCQYMYTFIYVYVCVQTCYTEASVWYDCVTPTRYQSCTSMSIDSMSLDGTPESFLLDGTNGFVSQVMGTSWFNTKSSRLCKSTEDTYREITGPHGKRAAHMMIKTGAICCFKEKNTHYQIYMTIHLCSTMLILVYLNLGLSTV